MKSLIHPSLLAAAIVTNAGAVTVVENFNSGTFPGAASPPAWTNGWSSSAGTATIVANPAAGSQLNGGGDYLSITGGSTNSNYTVRRSLNTTTFTSTTPYTISWDYRLDSPLSTFTAAGDKRIQFGSTISSSVAGSDDSTGWLIGVKSQGYGGTTPALNNQWFFYDNASSGTTTGAYSETHMNGTGIMLQSGVLYSFSVTVDPASRTYSASITVDGDPLSTVTQHGLRFRNQSTTNASHLYFGHFNGDNVPFSGSFDNLVIDTIPEPAAALLSALSLIPLLRRRR